MLAFDSQACADQFPSNPGSPNTPSLFPQWGSNGGYAAITGADVDMQIAYGTIAAPQWTEPVHIAPGNIILYPGTVGVSFRNHAPGVVATVSAGLAAPNEPTIAPTAAGVSSPTVAATELTGVINADGTIGGGSGFAVAHPSTGVYTVTFTKAFTTPPAVVASITTTVSTASIIRVSPRPTVNGFGINLFQLGGAAVDEAWDFLAVTTA